MSILFMDNFSQWGSGSAGVTNMERGVWASSTGGPTLVADPDGVSSGCVLLCNGTSEDRMRKVIDQGQQTTVGIAVRVYVPSLDHSGNSGGIIEWHDQNADGQAFITMDNSGYLHFYRDTTGLGADVLLASTTTPVMVAGSWIHLEAKMLVSDTVGTFELRVNEEVVIDETGLDTAGTTNIEISNIALGNASNGSFYFKDLIVWNDSGSVNNDFLGDCEVVTCLPESDDTFTGWASTGANAYSVIDETTPSDADYLTAEATDTTAVIVNLTDLDPDINTIKGLQTVVRALKTDAGTANMQVALISNGDYDNGDDHAVSTSATYYYDVSELSPDTAAAWTRSEVDAAKLSIDRTA